jgi:hypothetical protein
MNEGKIGAPYEYPDSYIHFLAFLKIGFSTRLFPIFQVTQLFDVQLDQLFLLSPQVLKRHLIY